MDKVSRKYEYGATNCNSMPFSAAWAYYGKVLVLVNAASLNGCVHREVKYNSSVLVRRLPSKLKGVRGCVHSQRPHYYVPWSI